MNKLQKLIKLVNDLQYALVQIDNFLSEEFKIEQQKTNEENRQSSY